MKITLRKYAEALADSLHGESDKAVIDGKIQNFLAMVLRRKKTKLLKRFFEVFSKVWHQKNGEVAVKVTLPYDPEKEEQVNLGEYLEEIFQKKIILDLYKDEDLIGGLKIAADDYVIDGSVASNLQTLKQKLINS